MTLVDFTLEGFLIFTLVLFRTSGVMLTAPVIGSQNLPVQLKLGLSMLLSLLVLPLLMTKSIELPATLGGYASAAVAETAIGLILGFSATLLFAAVQLAGMLIDQELGMSLANVIDPLSNEQVSVVGQLKLLLATALFLAVEGHHMVLAALSDSFAAVPLLSFRFTPELARHLGDDAFRDLFDIAVRLAGPTIVVMLISTVALGFLARAVPEMNIFIVGFSLRIMIGLLIIALTVGVFSGVFLDAAATTRSTLTGLFPLMR